VSDITRKKLTRGVLLGTEHVHETLDTVANTAIPADRVKVTMAPFRVNFNFPLLSGPGATINPLCMPFTLPPLQQSFPVGASSASRNVPQILLDEVSFSFDSRSEKGAIRVNAGLTSDPDIVKSCSVDISILEKKVSTSQLQFESEIVSMRIPGLQLTGSTTERFNPAYLDQINRSLDPHKMYILRIEAKDLNAISGDDVVMPNVNVSLRFRSKLDAHYSPDVQNAPGAGTPVVQKLQGSLASHSITNPGAGADIKAASPGGVQYEMDVVDAMFTDKIKGGLSKDGEYDAAYNLSDDAAYEVIAVPLFQCPVPIKGSNATTLPHYDWFGTYGAFDRRIIPLHYPVVIHHVIAVANYNAITTAVVPSVATFKHHVGVGLGRGIRSDVFTYQSVADAEWSPSDGSYANRIDKCGEGPASFFQQAFETINVPLIGSGGTGYKAAGKPVYAGRTQTARTDIGGSTPVTGGLEQFIEVRWLMKDTGSTALSGATNDVYVGAGGHWVYLICEKRLAGQRG